MCAFIFKVPFFLPSGPVLILIAFILPGMKAIEVVKFGTVVDKSGGNDILRIHTKILGLNHLREKVQIWHSCVQKWGQ